jgi:hypothetical protein
VVTFATVVEQVVLVPSGFVVVDVDDPSVFTVVTVSVPSTAFVVVVTDPVVPSVTTFVEDPSGLVVVTVTVPSCVVTVVTVVPSAFVSLQTSAPVDCVLQDFVLPLPDVNFVADPSANVVVHVWTLVALFVVQVGPDVIACVVVVVLVVHTPVPLVTLQ